MKKATTIIFGLIGLFIGLVFASTKIEASEVFENKNLASPNLTGKTYLGDGVYYLGGDINYNVYNGLFSFTDYTANAYYGFIDINTLPKGQLIFNLISEVNAVILIFDFTNNISVVQDKSFIFDTNNLTDGMIFGLYFIEGASSGDTFQLQIEKGSIATPYEVPIGALEQHSQLQYNSGYQQGYENGSNDGYTQGFNDGLDQVFNANNLMTIAQKKGKGTTGPSTEYFGFLIPLDIKVNRVTILNLQGYSQSLKPLDWVVSGVYQGLLINYGTGVMSYPFKDYYNEYNEVMEIVIEQTQTIQSITIVFALSNPAMPMPDFERMQDHMLNNLGVYVNNKIITDNAIDKFKQIIEVDIRQSLDSEYQQKYDSLYEYKLSQEVEIAFDKGYQDGVFTVYENGFGGIINPDNNNFYDETLSFPYGSGYNKGFDDGLLSTESDGLWGVLFSALLAPFQVLGIALLPGITIGMIVAVPLVFGLLAWILSAGKSKK